MKKILKFLFLIAGYLIVLWPLLLPWLILKVLIAMFDFFGGVCFKAWRIIDTFKPAKTYVKWIGNIADLIFKET